MYFFRIIYTRTVYTTCIIILSETIHTHIHTHTLARLRYYTEIVNEFLVVLNDISKTRNMRVNKMYTHILCIRIYYIYIIHVRI